MRCDVARHHLSWVPLSGVALLALLASAADAAGPYYYGYPAPYQYPQAAYYPTGYYGGYAMNPYGMAPYGTNAYGQQAYAYNPALYRLTSQGGYPNACYPAPCYQAPGYQQAPAAPQAPVQPMPPAQPAAPQQLPAPAVQPAPAPAESAPPEAQVQQPTETPGTSLAQSPESGQELGGAGTAVSAVSYIDNAIPQTMIRLRGEAAFRDIRPDRAEFFYAKCGCFQTAPPPFTDPRAPGPPKMETRVDYQQVYAYLEYAPTCRISGFLEVPFRFNEFAQNLDSQGLSDINFGFKAALIATCNTFLTLQVRNYVPSGAASQGLGTHHDSVEPAFLFYQGIGDRARIEAEVRDWIPFNGTDFSGNVLRYGLGASYDVIKTCKWRLAPVVEGVGWYVFDGKELDGTIGVPVSSAGETIFNLKGGLRWYTNHWSVAASYGRALTGDFWYKDIGRVEVRWVY